VIEVIRDTKRFSFALDSLTLLKSDKALAALAERYKPQEGLNFVAFTFHATAPEVNLKAMAITPPTMLASLDSAIHTMVDFEHRVDDIPIPANDEYDNEIMGHIVELLMGDIPDAGDKDAWALAPYIPNEPIITSGVMALYTRVFDIYVIANEVNRGASWFFSLEIGNGTTEPAIWLQASDDKPHEIIPWNDASQELRDIASQPKLMEYEGRNVAYLMGGADGKVPFIGGAITRNPAGFEQRQPGRQLMLIASADGAIQGSVADKMWQSEDWKKRIKASLKTRKEASNSDGEDSGIISPVIINDLDELIEVTDLVTELQASDDNDDDTGGETTVAKVELEQEDLDKKMADAKAEGETLGDTAGYERGKTEGAVSGVEAAVEAGTHIPADQVDGIVAKRLMAQTRETQIASLPCDDDTKSDFRAIANGDRYPLDADGETKFAEAFTRWKASMKNASDGDGEGGEGGEGEGKDGEGDDDKKKNASDGEGADGKKHASDEEGKKKDFDPGEGGGAGNQSLDEMLEMKVEEV